MKSSLRSAVWALGASSLLMASSVASAASYDYAFQTFYDTSTSLNWDDKARFSTPVATLKIEDISGGVKLTLAHLANAFPAKSGGTFVEALWLDGPNGNLKLTSSNTALTSSAGYSALFPEVQEDGLSYAWDIDFKAKTFAEGETATLTILGKGVTAKSFVEACDPPMIDLGNVASPYTGILGLNTSVHFVGSVMPAVPEPTGVALAVLGVAGLWGMSRRRKQA